MSLLQEMRQIAFRKPHADWRLEAKEKKAPKYRMLAYRGPSGAHYERSFPTTEIPGLLKKLSGGGVARANVDDVEVDTATGKPTETPPTWWHPIGEAKEGGKVLGHTKSGKEIHAPHDEAHEKAHAKASEMAYKYMDRHPDPAKRKEYRDTVKATKDAARKHVKETSKGYSKQDHVDAAQAHHEHYMKWVKDTKGSGMTLGQAGAHHDIASAHMDVARRMHKKEGKAAGLESIEPEFGSRLEAVVVPSVISEMTELLGEADDDDDGPSIPVETQIWNHMNGKERAEVMDAVGIKLSNPNAPKGVKALRACAAYIKKHLDKYKHVLKRNEDVLDEAAFACQECGKKFKKPPKSGECPRCHGTDIDVDSETKVQQGYGGYPGGGSYKTGVRHGRSEANDVANTIAQQMGGVGRIKLMLGAKQVTAIDNGLAIKWPNKDKTKGNYVEIRLDPSDTYTMEFFWMSGSSKKSVKKYDMIYADQLTSLFRDWTGWALKL